MSGPNDSSPDAAAGADLKLTLPEIGAKPAASDRFKLKVNWMTPHLEWRPLKGPDAAPAGAVEPSKPPPNADEALEAADRYFTSGKLLFGLGAPDWSQIDKAYLSLPKKEPLLFPSQEQLKSWENDVFFRGLSRTPYLIVQPAAPPMQTPPPLLGQPAPSLFYKLPDPAAQARDPGPPREGAMGDVLGALNGLPIMQRLRAPIIDAGKQQLRLFVKDWKQTSTWGNIALITFGATLTAETIGTIVAVGPARRLAFQQLLGATLPVPFVPGFSFRVSSLGTAANTALAGEKFAADNASKGVRAELMFDVPKFVDTVGKAIQFLKRL